MSIEKIAQKDKALSPADHDLQNCELSVEDLNKMEARDRELLKGRHWSYVVMGLNQVERPTPPDTRPTPPDKQGTDQDKQDKQDKNEEQ